MHVALSEVIIHYANQKKKLILIIDHLSLSTSYDEVKSILHCHNIQLTDMDSSQHLPVPA